LRPTDRFPSLTEAIEAVRRARSGDTPPTLFPQAVAPFDPDNLPPGTRVGNDYDVVSRIGQGGLAVVYAARHLVSGRTRALKVSRPEEAAESALRDEYRILSDLDHPNIVKVIDLTKMLEGRLTLVMERVSGETLRAWIERNKGPDLNAR